MSQKVQTDERPATRIVQVTPNDTADLPQGTCRALLIGSAGSLAVVDAEGNTVLGLPAQAGYNPLSVKRVLASGTTAATIFALY